MYDSRTEVFYLRIIRKYHTSGVRVLPEVGIDTFVQHNGGTVRSGGAIYSFFMIFVQYVRVHVHSCTRTHEHVIQYAYSRISFVLYESTKVRVEL